jgi:hypothetical protein
MALQEYLAKKDFLVREDPLDQWELLDLKVGFV